MRKTYEAHYAETADMTFIVCTEWNGDEVAAVEVVGWYCGEPEEKYTEFYKDKGVRAEYDIGH